MNNIINKAGLFTICIVLLILGGGCKKKMNISGKIEGAWQTQWENKIKKDNADLNVNETLFFNSDNVNGSKGDFDQIFQGNVRLEGNETRVPFTLIITGDWKVKDQNEVELDYDLNKLVLIIGNSNIEEDLDKEGVKLQSGEWIAGLLQSGMESEKGNSVSSTKKDEAKRVLTSFFKDRFHEINKDKGGLLSVEIEGEMMTCKDSKGAFGKKITYDKLDIDKLKAKAEKNSSKSDKKSSDDSEDKAKRSHEKSGYGEYDWLLTRRVTYSDIAGKSSKELRIMRNYIYARHNYRFKSADLMKHFRQYDWYSPLYDDVSSDLSSLEMSNVQFIKSYE